MSDTSQSVIDNGGARAIKGFNYQKSIVVLVSVLHYLSEDNFEIYVESKDDIVVKLKGTETYIQAKGKKLSVSALTQRPQGKDSILEKNFANGDEKSSYFKIISPSFANSEKYLQEVTPRIFRSGAKVFEYTEAATDEVIKKLPKLSKLKLDNSRVVLTDFKADIEEALTYIIGIMVKQGIPVDNNHGMVSLQEFCLQIDQRSERVVNDASDLELKKFTTENLSTIFSHSYKVRHFNDILAKLNYTVAKQEMLKTKRVAVAAIYKSFYDDAKHQIERLNILEMEESEVLRQAIVALDFTGVNDELAKEAIVLDAFSQVLFERSRR